jgi:hypothetical protein
LDLDLNEFVEAQANRIDRRRHIFYLQQARSA